MKTTVIIILTTMLCATISCVIVLSAIITDLAKIVNKIDNTVKHCCRTLQKIRRLDVG